MPIFLRSARFVPALLAVAAAAAMASPARADVLDDVKSHADFAKKYHVPFPLLSDANQATAKSYGVLTTHLGMHYAKRETFLIDPEGRVAKHYRDVDPAKNSKQVLADLATLKKTSG